MSAKRSSVLALAAALLLNACVPLVPQPGPWVQDTLYFGASRPDGGEVSDEQWEEFLDTEVTPRFPDGLTHWKAKGQWRGEEGGVGKEPSWVLVIVHPGSEEADQRLKDVAEAYKQMFEQKSVLRVRGEVEAAF